jgi:hypothetical protein
MSLISALREATGSVCGVAVYQVAKHCARIANGRRSTLPLPPDVVMRVKEILPDLELDRVRLRPHATLPANWWPGRARFSAMAFGYTIYLSDSFDPDSQACRRLLLHELVHADQVRRLGDSETRFASWYGRGFLAARSYRKNPLEAEAFEVVERFGELC